MAGSETNKLAAEAVREAVPEHAEALHALIEVPMLVVSGNARRRGVGKLLVNEIWRIAAEENATLIELVATKENDVARAFYKSLGFIETEHIALEFVGDMQQPPDPKE